MAIDLGHGEWLDFDSERVRLWSERVRSLVGPVLLGAALSALFLVALRVEILQLRYQLTDAVRHERDLKKQRAAMTARYWGLRDPMRLSAEAGDAFVAPDCVIDLPRTPSSARGSGGVPGSGGCTP